MFKNEGETNIKKFSIPETESAPAVFDVRNDVRGLNQQEIIEYFQTNDAATRSVRSLHGLKYALPQVWERLAKDNAARMSERIASEMGKFGQNVIRMAELQELDPELFARLFSDMYPNQHAIDNLKDFALEPQMTKWENIAKLAAYLSIRNPESGMVLASPDEARKLVKWNSAAQSAIEDMFVSIEEKGFVGRKIARTLQYYELDPEWCAEKILPLVITPRVIKDAHAWVRHLRDGEQWSEYFAFALNLDQLSKLLQKHSPPEVPNKRPTSRNI